MAPVQYFFSPVAHESNITTELCPLPLSLLSQGLICKYNVIHRWQSWSSSSSQECPLQVAVCTVQNATARLITGTRRRDHITPVLRELHLMPIREWIKFKVACLVRQSLSGHAPVYLADDCCLVSDRARRSLRTAVVPTSRDLVCGTPFRSSCAIQTSPTDCLDDSWRVTFLAKHEHSALWPRYAAP